MKGDKYWAIPVVLFLVTLAGLSLVFLGYSALPPWVGKYDDDAVGPKEFAELAIQSIQYVQSLTMAAFGGAILLLSQQLLGRGRARSDEYRRLLAAIGMILLVMSLLSGFVAIESVIEAAQHGLLQVKTDPLRNLRVLQAGFLLLGVGIIGSALLADTVRGVGKVEP